MIPVFEETVKNLSINEVTQTPVETEDGYYIIKRLSFDIEADAELIDDIRTMVLFKKSGLDVE